MVADGSTVTGRLLTFRVGAGRFAVLLDDVLGVQGSTEVGGVPGAATPFQGRAVTVFDVRRTWRDEENAPAPTEPPAVIFVRGGGGAAALMVDRVEGIVDGVEMRPLPSLVAPFVKDVFRGVTLHADGGRLVVDPAALTGSAAGGGQRGPGKA